VDQPSLNSRLLAEAVGTFGFFFIGFSGVAAAVNVPGSIGIAGIDAGFGLGLALMIGAFGHISGGHYNPAVTLGLAVAKRFPSAEIVWYWAAQLVGGLVAAILANILYTSSVKKAIVNHPVTDNWRALLLEAVATMLFVIVVFTAATDGRAPWNGVLAPVLIGGFIFTAALTVGASSGGSFNPARSLAPAIWAGKLGDVWIYLIGPLVGGAAGGWLSAFMREWPRTSREAATT
jgi:MIP family channel proteins